MSIHTLRRQVEHLQSAIKPSVYILQVWVQTEAEQDCWRGSCNPGSEPEGMYTFEEITTRNRELEREGYVIPEPLFIGRQNIGTTHSGLQNLSENTT